MKFRLIRQLKKRTKRTKKRQRVRCVKANVSFHIASINYLRIIKKYYYNKVVKKQINLNIHDFNIHDSHTQIL